MFLLELLHSIGLAMSIKKENESAFEEQTSAGRDPSEQLSPEQLDQVAGGNHAASEDNAEPAEETGEKNFFKYKKKKFFGFGHGHGHGHHH
ncbi:hypothetical protein S7335_3331 [Synechococcus sp. PCC 7335]|nr:hypothetical protein S7335_3331 [Synechococcus sp. PCC 7335]